MEARSPTGYGSVMGGAATDDESGITETKEEPAVDGEPPSFYEDADQQALMGLLHLVAMR